MSNKLDLSKLSREEKEELLLLLEEKAKRAALRRGNLKPHPGQLKVIMSDALEKYLFPGNGFGKSALLANELHWAATGWNPFRQQHTPVPAKIALVLATTDKVDEFITEYQKWYVLSPSQLHKRGKPHVAEITYDTSTTVTILTHDVNPLKLEGSQWTHIFFDEPPPKAVFTALYRGLRIKDRPGRVFLAGTPIAASWLRTDIFEPWSLGTLKNVECFKGRTEENKQNLEEGYIERFSAHLSAKEKAIRLEGEFFDLDGLALAHLFKRHTHLISRAQLPDKEDLVCAVICDPHPSKPHHAVLMGADRQGYLYVIDEFKEKAIARDFTRLLIERGWFTNYKVIDIVYDSLGSGDGTGGEGFRSFGEVMNEVLAEHSIGRSRATTYADKDDESFIDRIQTSLALPDKPDNFGNRTPKLRFVEDCKGSIQNVENVQWLQDKRNESNKPKLDIRNQDFLSCIKYGLATNLTFRKAKDHAFVYTRPMYGVDLSRARLARYRRHNQGG